VCICRHGYPQLYNIIYTAEKCTVFGHICVQIGVDLYLCCLAFKMHVWLCIYTSALASGVDRLGTFSPNPADPSPLWPHEPLLHPSHQELRYQTDIITTMYHVVLLHGQLAGTITIPRLYVRSRCDTKPRPPAVLPSLGPRLTISISRGHRHPSWSTLWICISLSRLRKANNWISPGRRHEW